MTEIYLYQNRNLCPTNVLLSLKACMIVNQKTMIIGYLIKTKCFKIDFKENKHLPQIMQVDYGIINKATIYPLPFCFNINVLISYGRWWIFIWSQKMLEMVIGSVMLEGANILPPLFDCHQI